MVDGCLSLMAMHFADWGKPVLADRGDGLVAGSAPFYRCYRCADDRFIAVGALERRFFLNLWTVLGYGDPAPDHMDRAIWPDLGERFETTFRERPRDVWAEAFAGKDACVTPVVDPAEALAHPQNRLRHPKLARDSAPVVPIFSATPGRTAPTTTADQSMEVLRSLGLSAEEAGRAAPPVTSTGLAWPPL